MVSLQFSARLIAVFVFAVPPPIASFVRAENPNHLDHENEAVKSDVSFDSESNVALLPMTQIGYRLPHCGPYCLYGAASSLGQDVPLDRLFSGEYFTPDGGVTADHLVQMADDNGLNARVIHGLDVTGLKALNAPTILQFNPLGPGQPAHWVLFLGVGDDGKLLISDPPNEIQGFSEAELQALWNGVGVVVWRIDQDGPDSGLLYLASLLRRSAWMVVPVLFSCLAMGIDWRYKNKWITGRWACLGQAFGLVAIVSLWSAIVIVYWPERSEQAAMLRSLECFTKYDAEDLTDVEYVKSFDGADLVIDCRVPLAFRQGHVDGAVNVPIDAGFVEWRTLADRLSPDTNVIVYCQSVQCSWGAIASRRLRCLGISAKVYVGGYERYQRVTEDGSGGKQSNSSERKSSCQWRIVRCVGVFWVSAGPTG